MVLRVESLRRDGLGPISLMVEDGECLAVTGPSGAGKSLLLRAIADLDPNEGAVFANAGERVRMPAPAWRRAVAYVPAEPGWWGDAVRDHFDSPLPAALLQSMGLGPEVFGAPVARLSTGERHRLALARCIARSPEVLLLDEPTAALDEGSKLEVEAVLKACLEDGASLLLVTHDSSQAARLATRSIRLRAGRLDTVSPDSGGESPSAAALAVRRIRWGPASGGPAPNGRSPP